MNNLITKLNIIKSNTLVKKGQMIYNSLNNLTTKENEDLPEGFYIVKSVQLTHSNEGSEGEKKRYLHNLNLLAINCDGKNELSLGSNSYNVSVGGREIKSNFGVGRVAAKGIIYEYIKDQFEKVGKEGFKENIDYDRIFRALAWKAFKKSKALEISKDDGEDMIINSLMRTITPKTVKNFDPKRNIEKFFGVIFYKDILDEMKKYLRERRREEEPQDLDKGDKNFTEEERFDYRTKDKSETPEDQVKYRVLVEDLKKFIKGRVRGDKQLKILDDMIAGYSSSEIAQRNNISNSLVSRITNDIRNSIVEYANKTNNDELNLLMSKHSKKRMHSEEDVTIIYNVLKEYKKRFGAELKKREPSGETIKVKKVVLEDKVSDAAIAKVILNDTYSSKALKSELNEYFSFLDDQDELIDSKDGKLVGLKIVSDEVRSVENEAKCKKEKKSNLAKKEKGFFVYSKSSLGPHKVLKINGTFSIKLNRGTPVKIFKSKVQAEKATSRYQHTKLSLYVGVYPDEYLKEEF